MQKQSILNELASLLSEIETWQPYELKYFGPTSRNIPIFGEINRQVALSSISQILHLSYENPDEPITIWLNTEGGSITDGFAIYDAIKNVEAPVIVYATGSCASAGLIILCAGDYKIATKNCTFFYHEPVFQDSTVSSLKDMDQLQEYYQRCKEQTNEIFKKTTKMKKQIWSKNFEGKTSFYFTSEEALGYKFIDMIAESEKQEFKFETSV